MKYYIQFPVLNDNTSLYEYIYTIPRYMWTIPHGFLGNTKITMNIS